MANDAPLIRPKFSTVNLRAENLSRWHYAFVHPPALIVAMKITLFDFKRFEEKEIC
jgi:hypothetical protein